MLGLGERAHLADQRLGPIAGLAFVHDRLGDVNTTVGDDVGHEVQTLGLVSAAGVVGTDRDTGTLQILDDRNARGLVLHEHHVHFLARFAVDRAVLLHDLGAQVRIREVVLPRVDEHDAHGRVVVGPEHAPHRASRGVVDGLVGVRAVVGLHDVQEVGEGLLRVPQAEPAAFDDAVVLGVDHLGVQLLPPDACALVLRHDFVTEGRREVVKVLVRCARGHEYSFVRNKPTYNGNGLRRSRDAHPGSLTQAQAEHEVGPHVFSVTELGKFVNPSKVMLWAAQSLRVIVRVDGGDRSIRPLQSAFRGYEHGFARGVRNGQDT